MNYKMDEIVENRPKFQKYVLWIALFFSFVACSKEIELNEFEFEKHVVVNCFFTADEAFKLRISESFNVLEKPSGSIGKTIGNAEVKVFENNELMGILNFGGDVAQFYSNPEIIPQTGKTYRIEVRVPGYDLIEAESYIPPMVATQSVIDTLHQTEIYGGGLLEVYRLRFTDAPEENQYLLSITPSSTIITDPERLLELQGNIEISSDDPVIGFYNYGLKQNKKYFFDFSDKLYQGRSYNLIFWINKHRVFKGFVGLPRVTLNIHLNNLSEDFGKYLNSVNATLEAQANPLSETVLLYSNVKNGLGIFAGFSRSTQSIELINPNIPPRKK